jgi:hypothetical protein
VVERLPARSTSPRITSSRVRAAPESTYGAVRCRRAGRRDARRRRPHGAATRARAHDPTVPLLPYVRHARYPLLIDDLYGRHGNRDAPASRRRPSIQSIMRAASLASCSLQPAGEWLVSCACHHADPISSSAILQCK